MENEDMELDTELGIVAVETVDSPDCGLVLIGVGLLVGFLWGKYTD